MDREVLSNVCKYLIINYQRQITLNELEKMFYFEKNYLSRSFKTYTGYTIMEYLNYIRIYNSMNDLFNPNNTLLKVALKNGFNSLEYFSEMFRKVIGESPIKIRNKFNNYSNKDELIYNYYLLINLNKKKLENFAYFKEKEYVRKKVINKNGLIVI